MRCVFCRAYRSKPGHRLLSAGCTLLSTVRAQSALRAGAVAHGHYYSTRRARVCQGGFTNFSQKNGGKGGLPSPAFPFFSAPGERTISNAEVPLPRSPLSLAAGTAHREPPPVAFAEHKRAPEQGSEPRAQRGCPRRSGAGRKARKRTQVPFPGNNRIIEKSSGGSGGLFQESPGVSPPPRASPLSAEDVNPVCGV